MSLHLPGENKSFRVNTYRVDEWRQSQWRQFARSTTWDQSRPRLHDFKLPPQCKWDLRFWGMLRSVYWLLVTDVSGPLKMGPLSCPEPLAIINPACLTSQKSEDRGVRCYIVRGSCVGLLIFCCEMTVFIVSEGRGWWRIGLHHRSCRSPCF
jgi:hypothetical protein